MTEEHGLPIVRACQVARLSRAAYYKPGMDWAARDGELIEALQAIVTEEQRWGFWKCHDRLRAQGFRWNHKRTWRVYCQLRLNLPRRTKRRVPRRERQPLWVGLSKFLCDRAILPEGGMLWRSRRSLSTSC